MEVEIRDGLREIDVGKVTGRTMAELDTIPIWHVSSCGNTHAPGGELMLEGGMPG